MKWIDPREKIWGFHVHQELPKHEFGNGLLIQQACAAYLRSHQVFISHEEALKPGYGPHLNYLWELRIEQEGELALEKMGLAISFMAINRFGLSAYIHPLMHDTSLPDFELLAMEGKTNQANILWFTQRVEQNPTYFFNPTRDNQGNLLDTRTSRLLSLAEKEQLKSNAVICETDFFDPFDKITFGYHIHMDFTRVQANLALVVYDQFINFLYLNDLIPTSSRIYSARENGPHLLSGWEVKFENRDVDILKKIGLALGWLMCNRQGLPIFMHPVTWLPGDVNEELHAHQHYSMFIDSLPELNLDFFVTAAVELHKSQC